MELVFALIALLIGCLVGWLARTARQPTDAVGQAELAALRPQLEAAGARRESLESEVAELRPQLAAAGALGASLEAQLEAAGDREASLQTQVATLRPGLAAAGAREEALQAQVATIRADREQLLAQFKAVSADVLTATSKELKRQDDERRSSREREAAAQLEQRTQAVDALVKPLSEHLAKFDEKVERLEGERKRAAGTLEAQLRTLGEGVGALGKNADSLVTALRRPNVRGAWGELQLRTAFEHAGLVEGVNFDLQHTLAGDEDGGSLRPDAVVFLPGAKSIAVDAKVPFLAYQEACETTDEEVARERMAHHARQVRHHVKTLGGKEYQRALATASHATPDFVVMFIPSEAMYFAALEADPTLLEDAIKAKVLLAAPMSLIAILQAVHVGWQQERIAENAREIAMVATELHKRFGVFFEHFDGIGRSLGTSVKKYNEAVGSFERSLAPQFRRLEDHQIKSGKATPALGRVEAEPREIAKGMTVELGAGTA